MKVFLNLQRLNFFRSIFTVRLIVCSLLTSVIIWVTTLGFVQPHSNVIELLDFGLSGSHGILMLILGTIPLIPFTLSFASEWKQRAVFFWTIRTGVAQYTISKLFFSLLSAFLTTALGLTFFVLIGVIFFPLFQEPIVYGPFADLLQDGQLISYFLFYFSHVALSSVLFALIGFFISTMTPNVFVTISAPVVVYYLLHRLTSTLPIPIYLKALYVFESVYDLSSPLHTLGLKLLIVILCVIPLTFLAVKNVQRKVAYG